DEVERLDVGARRNLRHYPAEGGVLIDLGEHDVGQNPPGPLSEPFDHRRRGLIAGRFDAEHNHPEFPLTCAANSVCSLPQPNPTCRVWSSLRFAGSGQARSRLGEGREGGDAGDAPALPHTTTPTPNPSPQGGGEHTETAARNVAHETTRNAGSLGALSPDFAAAPSGLRCFGRLRPA